MNDLRNCLQYSHLNVEKIQASEGQYLPHVTQADLAEQGSDPRFAAAGLGLVVSKPLKTPLGLFALSYWKAL